MAQWQGSAAPVPVTSNLGSEAQSPVTRTLVTHTTTNTAGTYTRGTGMVKKEGGDITQSKYSHFCNNSKIARRVGVFVSKIEGGFHLPYCPLMIMC